MELFKIFGKIGVDNKEANAKLNETSRQASKAASSMQTAFRNVGTSIRNNFNPEGLQNFGTQVQNVGNRISGVGTSLTKSITAPVLGAATAVGGLATALGFKRLVGIDTARGQFKGLGHDADAVMEQVDKGVTGTALSMAEGAAMAVGILATGNLPLSELEAQIQRTANVSAAYGVDASQAGYLLNNVLTKNKVTYGDLSQMVQNQIPIISMLADHYGVTGDEIEKMAGDGKISIEDLNEVIDKNAGAAAEEYAKTWRGVTSNILSNLGRVGAKFLEPTFEILKDKAADLLEFLRSEDIAAFAEDMGNRMATALGWVVDKVNELITWWQNLSTEQKNLALTITGIVVAAGPVLIVLGKLVTFAGSLISGFGKAWGVLNKVRSIFGLSAVSGGQLILVLARFLGPIGLVATAFMLLWNNSETFREGLQRIWDTLVSAVQPLFETITNDTLPRLREAFSSIMDALEPIIGFLMDVFVAAFDFVFPFIVSLVEQAINNVVGVIEGLITFFMGVIDVVTGLFTGDWGRVWDGVKQIVSGAVQAVWNLVQLWFLGKLIGIVRSLGTGLLNLFRNSWSSIYSTVRNFVSGILSTISSIFNNIRNVTSNVWNAIRNVISNVVIGIRSVISNVFNVIRNIISNITNGIRSTIGNAFNGAKNLAVNAFNSMRTSVTNTISLLLSTVSKIPSQITSSLGNLGKLLLNSGKSLIQGFIDGIKSMIGKATGAISNVVGAVRNFLPFSPAKKGPFSGKGWTLYSGQSITESLGEGMEDKESSLLSKARSVMSDLKEELDPSLNASVTGAAGMMTHNVFPQRGREQENQNKKLDEMISLLSELVGKETTLNLDGKQVAQLLGKPMNETLGKTATQNRRGAR